MKSTVKAPIGMQGSWYYPITAEPPKAKPVYGAEMDMGHGVKGYLSVTTATAEIPGDDAIQLSAEKFAGGQFDAETTMSDLEINAKIFGHTYSEEGGEVSAVNDMPPSGGYAYIQTILTKEKKIISRATCLHKVTAIASSEKQEADTRKPTEFAPKNNAVSYKITTDNTGAWRTRKDFASYDEAKAFIDTVFAPAAAG